MYCLRNRVGLSPLFKTVGELWVVFSNMAACRPRLRFLFCRRRELCPLSHPWDLWSVITSCRTQEHACGQEALPLSHANCLKRSCWAHLPWWQTTVSSWQCTQGAGCPQVTAPGDSPSSPVALQSVPSAGSTPGGVQLKGSHLTLPLPCRACRWLAHAPL